MKTLQDIMFQFYGYITVNNIEKLKNKTILITGASGLIGSNLIAYLDQLNKEKKLKIKLIGIVRSKLEKWQTQSPDIQYIKLNLSTNKLPSIKFDYLIHAATYGQPKKVLENKKETVRLNTDVLFNLLELAKKNNSKVLFISSSEVYGEPDRKHLFTEESYFGNVNTLSDRALYAEAKRMAETICYSFRKDVNIKIARTLIAYGPGIKYGDKRVIGEFIKKAQNEKKIVLMDEGSAQRTFCFISDTIEMLLNIIINGKGIVYNVSGKYTVSIKKLAEIIAKINHVKIDVPNKREEISGTPQRSTISNKRYCNEFHKKSFISLNTGLEVTSNWLSMIKTL